MADYMYLAKYELRNGRTDNRVFLNEEEAHEWIHDNVEYSEDEEWSITEQEFKKIG